MSEMFEFTSSLFALAYLLAPVHAGRYCLSWHGVMRRRPQFFD